MDYVSVESLRCKGIHGHYPEEHSREQEFVVDIRLEVDAAAAARSDRLEDAIDYDWIKGEAERVFAGPRRYLIERLGAEILERLFADTRILGGRIIIRKTEVWDNGVPSVSIERRNPAASKAAD